MYLFFLQGDQPRGRASPTYDDYRGDDDRKLSRSRSPPKERTKQKQSGIKLKRNSKNVQNIRSLWKL
jgi:hypothetical protein